MIQPPQSWWNGKERKLLKEEKLTNSELPGVPAGGLRRVEQIRGTNELILHAGQNGMAVALELLSTHTPGAPVVDDHNEFIGFISEVDVLQKVGHWILTAKLTTWLTQGVWI
jgi:predicted transcriptional regulator